MELLDQKPASASWWDRCLGLAVWAEVGCRSRIQFQSHDLQVGWEKAEALVSTEARLAVVVGERGAEELVAAATTADAVVAMVVAVATAVASEASNEWRGTLRRKIYPAIQ